MPTSKDRQCAVCGRVESSVTSIESHHVLGRIGENKDEPYNLINLCTRCHHLWHSARSTIMEDTVYLHMKAVHGDLFPMTYHGRPYYTKWLLKTEARLKPKED